MALPDRYNSRTAVLEIPAGVGTEPGGRVLGVDPGLTRTGWAAIAASGRGYGLVSAGVISSRATESFERRLASGFRRFDAVIEEQAPRLIVMEDLFTTPRFPRAALRMAHLRGVLCLAAELRGISVLSLTATTVKLRLTGNGHASKEQVQRMVFQLCDVSGAGTPSDLSDAIALAIAGYHQAASRAAAPDPVR